MPYQAVTQLRLQLIKFLRRNKGKLAQPAPGFGFLDMQVCAAYDQTRPGSSSVHWINR